MNVSSVETAENFIGNKQSIKSERLGFFIVRSRRPHRIIPSGLSHRVACLSQPCSRVPILHPPAQSQQSLLLIARIFRRQPGQRVRHYIAVVQVLHLRIAAEVQPKPMYQLHVIRPQRRCVGANVERLRLTIWRNDVKRNLLLRLRQCFPCLAYTVGLLVRAHLARKP